jgi:hypothetical protein
MIMGEYRIEVRDNSVTEVWRPSVDADPIPDHNDMATETAAQKQRELVTRWNRETGWYKYRTIYVPDRSSSIYLPDPLTERIVRD